MLAIYWTVIRALDLLIKHIFKIKISNGDIEKNGNSSCANSRFSYGVLIFLTLWSVSRSEESLGTYVSYFQDGIHTQNSLRALWVPYKFALRISTKMVLYTDQQRSKTRHVEKGSHVWMYYMETRRIGLVGVKYGLRVYCYCMSYLQRYEPVINSFNPTYTPYPEMA